MATKNSKAQKSADPTFGTQAQEAEVKVQKAKVINVDEAIKSRKTYGNDYQAYIRAKIRER